MRITLSLSPYLPSVAVEPPISVFLFTSLRIPCANMLNAFNATRVSLSAQFTPEQVKTLTEEGKVVTGESQEESTIKPSEVAALDLSNMFSASDVAGELKTFASSSTEFQGIKKVAEQVEGQIKNAQDIASAAQKLESLAASDSFVGKLFIKCVLCCGGPMAKIFGISPAEEVVIEQAAKVEEELKNVHISAMGGLGGN